MAETSFRTCPSCSRPNPAYRTTCWGCRASLGTATAGSPGASLTGVPPAAPALVGSPGAVRSSPSQTVSGLRLLIVGFGIAWIPFVGFVGGILALVGLVHVWNGRRELPAPHPSYVLAAVICLLLGIVGTIGGVLAVGVAGGFTTLLVTLPWVVAGGGAIGLLAVVLLVYAAADRPSRGLLWAGFGAGVAVTFVLAWIESRLILGIIGTSSSLGPGADLTSLLGVSYLLEAIPFAIFAVAYYLVRDRLVDEGVAAPRLPTPAPR